MTDYLEIDIDVFCFKIKIQLTGNSIVVLIKTFTS